MKVDPDTSAGANQDFNSQTPAPARLARNPAERAVAREDLIQSYPGPVTARFALSAEVRS